MARKSTGSKNGRKQNKQASQDPVVMNFEPRRRRVVEPVSDLDSIGSDGMLPGMTPEMGETMSAMAFLCESGITPKEYELFYNLFETARQVTGEGRLIFDDDDEMNLPDLLMDGFSRRNSTPVKEYAPLSDAADRTLVLKIQMKDVTKPPMWREVEVPANFDFMRLHEVIQAVAGLEDCHLWQFNAKAYDDSLMIGYLIDSDFATEPTHEAEETPLTQFLQQKGDKLEYVYDFGDDWIFTVEVKDVLAKRSEHPVCRKHKSDLNAIEDFGGVWSYLNARHDLEQWDTMTPKEKEMVSSDREFETPADYIRFLKSHIFYPNITNNLLSEIIK